MITKFGKEIRKLRVARNMKLYNLAEKINVSMQHLSAIEIGVRNITPRVLARILEAFKLKKSDKERLTMLAYQGNTFVKIDISKESQEKRELAVAFASSFNLLKKPQVKAINKILGGKRK